MAELSAEQWERLYNGVCPRHRDTAPGVYVCRPCETAGDAVVADLVANAQRKAAQAVLDAVEAEANNYMTWRTIRAAARTAAARYGAGVERS